jgi:hypothetical protein
MKLYPIAHALFGLTLCVGLSSCKIDGSMNVASPLTIIGSKSTAVIAPGNYRSQLDTANKNKFNLFIFNDPKSDNSIKLSFYLPAGDTFPEYDGSLNLTAAQDRQNYGSAVQVATNVQSGPEQQGPRACTYYITQTVCTMVHVVDDKDKDGKETKGHDERQCGQEQVPESGSQFVRFHLVTTTTGRSVEVIDPKSNAVIATFSSSDPTTVEDDDFVGRCS